MEPWGTPALTLVHEEDSPFNTTLCFLFVKKFLKTFSKLPDILFSCNLNIRPSCQTLSNTFEMSRKRAALRCNDYRIELQSHSIYVKDFFMFNWPVWLKGWVFVYILSSCGFESRCSHLRSDSHLPKKIFIICFNDSPSKMMKDTFYFILKALFVLTVFKFLSWLFGLIRRIKLILKLMTS